MPTAATVTFAGTSFVSPNGITRRDKFSSLVRTSHQIAVPRSNDPNYSPFAILAFETRSVTLDQSTALVRQGDRPATDPLRQTIFVDRFPMNTMS
jgi:hypothetical protein